MKIKSLKLTNFRNHKDLKIDFEKEVTLIVGKNGVGKTNILEAINLLSTTKSFKADKDLELIKFGNQSARIEALIEIDNEEKSLEVFVYKDSEESELTSKSLKVNGVSRNNVTFLQNLKSVLFTPQDLEIISGSPTLRRKFVDTVLVQAGREYISYANNYIKSLRQRNKVLEQINRFGKGHEILPIWTDKLIEYGTYIQNKRKELFNEINQTIENNLHLLEIDQNDIQVKYLINEINLARFWEYSEKELLTKNTLIGPHRDDFEIKYKGSNVDKYGSRGQQRTSLTSLKLSEIDFLTKNVLERPILLLDDIYSELDDIHKKELTNITKLQQTIITSTENFLSETDNIHIINLD